MESENSSNISGVEDNDIPKPQSVNASTPQLPTSTSTSTSLRKRPRKGIPQRSPLQ